MNEIQRFSDINNGYSITFILAIIATSPGNAPPYKAFIEKQRKE